MDIEDHLQAEFSFDTMQMKLIVLLCQKALGSSWMTEESKAESRPMLARITDHHHYHHSAPKFEKKISYKLY